LLIFQFLSDLQFKHGHKTGRPERACERCST